MNELQKLWQCWVLNPGRKKPYWETYIRLLVRYPVIPDATETEPYLSIYREQLGLGNYRIEPLPRGRWADGKWFCPQRLSR